ncbi:hypothetical protein ACA910_010973 [Epithemia clementina (nom. ined.)]
MFIYHLSDTTNEFGMDAMGSGQVGSSFYWFASWFGAVQEDALLTPGMVDVFCVSSFDNKSPISMLPSSSTSSSSSPHHLAVVGPSQRCALGAH